MNLYRNPCLYRNLAGKRFLQHLPHLAVVIISALQIHHLRYHRLYRRVVAADYVSSLQLESGTVSLHLHATRQALADVHDVHASVGCLVQQSHDPRGMRSIARTEGTHHDTSEVWRFHHVAHNVILDTREETEHDDVLIELQMWNHWLSVIRRKNVMVVILEIDSYIAEVRVVE